MKIKLIDRDGEARTLDATPGLSLMEVIRNSGVDELVAQCGGCCSCATCHVYVRDKSGLTPEVTEDEDDLLDTSDYRNLDSRLSCQIPIVEGLDGMEVTIAPED